jgi:hypothetical protein
VKAILEIVGRRKIKLTRVGLCHAPPVPASGLGHLRIRQRGANIDARPQHRLTEEVLLHATVNPYTGKHL